MLDLPFLGRHDCYRLTMSSLRLQATSIELQVSSAASPEVVRPDLQRIQRDVLSLFDECSGGLHRYVVAFGLAPASAEDVVQETFLALFRHLVLGRRQDHLRGWIYCVARNLALKQRRRTSRWAHGDATRLLATRSDDGPGPEERMVERQRREQLRAVARALPERDRRCLYLRAEGLNYREIARALNVSLGSVSKSLTRAFARLAHSERR